jgi:hypothetical protein
VAKVVTTGQGAFTGKVIGQVEGIRDIPRGSQPSVKVLGIKLFS